jgi:predicted transcriptional regulator
LGFVSGDEELRSFFWPWQVRLIVEIWQRREMSAKAAFEFLMKDRALSSGLSRASVMTFLEGLASDGILVCNEDTGRGGWIRVYEPAMSWDQLIRHLTSQKTRSRYSNEGFEIAHLLFS